MNITEEQLREIEAFAQKILPPDEIAILVEIDKRVFYEQLLKEDSQIYKAYMRGLLRTKAEINASIVKLAKAGSGPAQAEAKKMLKEEQLNRIKDL